MGLMSDDSDTTENQTASQAQRLAPGGVVSAEMVGALFAFDTTKGVQGPWSTLVSASVKRSGEKITLATSSFRVEERHIDSIVSRLHAVHALGPALSPVGEFGVDPNGAVFAIMPSLDGFFVRASSSGIMETERRYLSAVRLVSRLHAENIVLGDISPFSFWVEPEGGVKLVSVLGAPPAWSQRPQRCAEFIAPELGAAQTASWAGDVYALGILGFHLFAGSLAPLQAVTQGTKSLKDVIDAVKTVPGWFADIMRQSLAPDPEFRVKNAQDLLKEIISAREKHAARRIEEPRQEASSRSRTVTGDRLETFSSISMGPREPQSSAAEAAAATKDKQRQSAVKTTSKKQTRPPRPAGDWLWRGCAVVTALVVGLACSQLWLASQEESDTLKQNLAVHGVAVEDQNLKQAIAGIGESQVDVEEKKAYFERMSASDDPVAHQVLLDSAKDARSEKIRTLAEMAILDRARRLGLRRSVEIVRQWLSSAGDKTSYDAVMKTLDSTLPIAAREEVLLAIWNVDREFGLRLATAVALDSNDVNAFQPTLARLFEAAGKPEFKDRSVMMMILGDPELLRAFGDEAVPSPQQVKNEDVPGLVEMLALREDNSIVPFLDVALERGLVPEQRRIYLQIFKEQQGIPAPVRQALVKAAFGTLQPADLPVFGRWYDEGNEQVLLNLCAESPSPEIVRDAFELVAAKSIQSEPGASLLPWIRANHWVDREKLARPFALLARASGFGEKEIGQALEAFDAYQSDEDLIAILTGAENANLVEGALRRFAKHIGIPRYLTLLSHPAKSVRLASIDGLKEVNDLGALKLIVDMYKQEKDEEVRKKYVETFWMLKNRGSF